MKKNIFKLMLLYLYDKYSKKEGKSLALLHGKALLSVAVIVNLLVLFYCLEKYFKTGYIYLIFFSGQFYVLNIFICLLIFLFVSKVTYNKKTIELVLPSNIELKKGKNIFWMYYIGSFGLGIILVFILGKLPA